MKKTIIETAYAKINLFLDVKGKRDDGYHELESVMQTVSLCDTVSLTVDTDTSGRSISITCTDPTVPCDNRNIAFKCADAFLSHCGINNASLCIDIDKKIPSSGGLAGGSSDGAAVLRALNKIFPDACDIKSLYIIASKLGADIPFCIRGGTCICTGIGDVLSPVNIPLPQYSVLIVLPGGGVSTPEAYSLIDSEGSPEKSGRLTDVTDPLKKGEMPQGLYNSFEKVIEKRLPQIVTIKEKLILCGAHTAMMSGSGPTVFAVFDSSDTALKAGETMNVMGFSSYICTPVSEIVF